MPTIALSAMPVFQQDGTWVSELSQDWIQDPVMGIVFHLPEVVRPVMWAWVGLLAATILIIATNAGILGLSRLVYSLGRHRQLPQALTRLHPRSYTPYVAIGVFSAVAALLILPGRVEILADLYSFGAMLAFTFAHISVIALRVKEPNLR